MKEIISNKDLIAFCGLYCGACKRYLNGKCPGCAENKKAGWCKIRKCCKENSYLSCADCTEYNDVMQCKFNNNLMAKLFSIIFRSNRVAGIEYIKDNGYESFAEMMTEKGLVSIKK